MSNRLNYYYRQKVTEAELDSGFANLEAADRALAVDHALWGVVNGLVVSQHASPQNLTVDVTAGTGYDKLGERINVGSPQTVNCAVDEGAVSTAVVTPGNSKVVSVYAKFFRVLSDPRIDGNSLTVYFNEAEGFQFVVRQGAEAASNPSPPALDSTLILLCDITFTFGMTQILNAGISTSRREDLIVAAGTPRSLRNGTIKAAFTSLLGFYDNHASGSADRHFASHIDGTVTGNWADGTQVAGGTVQAMLQEIVSDLGQGTAGAAKIAGAATGNWADATGVGAGSVQAMLNEIVSDLAANGGTEGAGKIGTQARSAVPHSLAAGSTASQLSTLLARLNEVADIAAMNFPFEFTGDCTQPFQNSQMIAYQGFLVGCLNTTLGWSKNLQNWTDGSTGYGGPGPIYDLVTDGTTILATDGTVFKTTDKGNSWASAGTNTTGAGTPRLGLRNGIWIYMRADALRTDADLSGAWTSQDGQIPGSWAGVAPKAMRNSPNELLIVSATSNKPLIRTVNGTTFTATATPAGIGIAADVRYHPIFGHWLIVESNGSPSKTFYSTDGGQTWTAGPTIEFEATVTTFIPFGRGWVIACADRMWYISGDLSTGVWQKKRINIPGGTGASYSWTALTLLTETGTGVQDTTRCIVGSLKGDGNLALRSSLQI